LQAFVDPAASLVGFKTFLGWDLTEVDIDGPPPPPPLTEGWQSRQQLAYDLALRENLTVRQLVGRMAAARGHLVLVGTPEDIVDELEAWFRDGAPTASTFSRRSCPKGSTTSSNSSCPNCGAGACSAPNTKERACASISALPARNARTRVRGRPASAAALYAQQG
jgi:hypothetical protein